MKFNQRTTAQSNESSPEITPEIIPVPNRLIKRAVQFILSFLCVIVLLASWILNFGWIRILLAIPMLIHTVIFCISNVYFSKYDYSTKKIRLINHFVYITYLLTYILLPDIADDAMMFWAVFGLIRNQTLIDILWMISLVSFSANMILIILQFVHSSRDRRKMKRIKKQVLNV